MAAYARQGVNRAAVIGSYQSGWSVVGNNATLTNIVAFPQMLGGTSYTATYFGCGLNATAGTAGQLLFFGTVTPPITINNGVQPKLDTGTQISQATSDNMANTAATNLLLLLFNNTAWATFGDATGIVGSTGAGALWLSLHYAALDETSNQATSEVTYT
jgi:hypothetical protein